MLQGGIRQADTNIACWGALAKKEGLTHRANMLATTLSTEK